MEKVYRNSFQNISATAAHNSDEGLYSERQPYHLWEDLVSININGLALSNQLFHHKNKAVRLSESYNDDHFAKIRSCFLVDVSMWDTLVNQAPVNGRAWVVQERLLARRVLHFCEGHIAWERSEFEEIEGRAPGIPSYELIGGKICKGIPMKALNPDVDGKQLRQNRLQSLREPFQLLKEPVEDNRVKAKREVFALELWARIVSMYSKTGLTKEVDKLIALSGIASQMSVLIGSEEHPAEYVAGIWRPHLISQLLWKVDPLYVGGSDSVGRPGTFAYPSTRPKEQRAPSFSWASIDAQNGNGITYGEVLDDRHIFVRTDGEKSIHVQRPGALETENKFGQVFGGHVVLRGWIHKVQLQRKKSLCSWKLDGYEEEHTNVYMDCPAYDNRDDRLVQHNSEVYCLPVALGSPTTAKEESKDLICLLLEKISPGQGEISHAFRRVGLSKINPAFDSVVLKNIPAAVRGLRVFEKMRDSKDDGWKTISIY